MALDVGSKIAHYEITALIGEGGMGRVYQATDTKLNRQVALKILPDAFASDPDRLARFQREAQVLASLNHPGIAGIYGLEEQDGTKALVLELVEGPTLADRIAQGAIAVAEALPIAKQIAEALEAAHEQGIIHRDLKPANIKVRPDGTVKVLDFGLAKALDTAPEGDPSQSPTLTAAATQMGVIMGTAAYMSPEQARGKPVDRRADIWAFGCVLFEMLTGRMAFEGQDVSLTLSAVLQREPDWDAVPTELSPVLGTFLRRCLAKDPTRRLHDVADIRLAMDGEFDIPAAATLPHLSVRQRVVWRWVPWATVLLLPTVVGLAVWALTRPEPGTAPVERFVIPPPMPQTVGVTPYDRDVAISPDGRHLVYQVTGGNPFRLLARPLDAVAATALHDRNTQVFGPFVSSDSGWVGFYNFSDNTLEKVSVLGGPPVVICSPAAPPVGVSWGEDDTIIFGTFNPSGLWRVSANGGDPEELTTTGGAQAQVNHAWPHLLPGGRALLYTILTGQSLDTAEHTQIALFNFETQEQKVLISGGGDARYSSTGHIVYGVDGTLRAVGFDLDQLEVTNRNPVPVVEGVTTKPGGAAAFDLARDGSLLYVTGTGRGTATNNLVWMTRDGREEAIDIRPGDYTTVRVSPDGRHLALHLEGDVWTYEIERGALERVTTHPARDRFPIWTPDGTGLVFESNRGGSPGLFWAPADGTGTPENILTVDDDIAAMQPAGWTPDGKILLFTIGRLGVERGEPRRGDIGMVTVTLEDEPNMRSLIEDEFNTRSPTVSPDGRWMAYESDLSGSLEVYVERFPALGDRQLVSTNGGRSPRWSPDGQQLFYFSFSATDVNYRQVPLMAVPIVTEPTLQVGVPEFLFEGPFETSLTLNRDRSYDLTPDGDRFVMIRRNDVGIGADETPQIVLVQNFFEELKRLVPRID